MDKYKKMAQMLDKETIEMTIDPVQSWLYMREAVEGAERRKALQNEKNTKGEQYAKG